jgi:Flp pilus assembly protein TadD
MTMSAAPGAPNRSDCDHGIDLFLAGAGEEAAAVLTRAVAAEPGPRASLALGKVLLELLRGDEAYAHLAPLLAPTPPPAPALHAYVRLLTAAAAALAGRPEEARTLLGEVSALDPRLELAARSLERRLERGRPPVVRF